MRPESIFLVFSRLERINHFLEASAGSHPIPLVATATSSKQKLNFTPFNLLFYIFVDAETVPSGLIAPKVEHEGR